VRALRRELGAELRAKINAARRRAPSLAK